MNPALQAVITIGLGVGGCLVYFYGSNLFLDKVLYPPRGPNAGRNINRANMIRPWLFLFPAIVLLGLYLAYPVVATLWLSLNKQVGTGSEFVGFANYAQMMSEEKFWESMQNNMVWLVVVPAMSTAFGLLAAQLTDRIKWGNIAKSLIFMPMAISFVGASVIWKLVYDSRDAAVAQIGALNAVWMKFEGGIWSVLFLRVLPVVLLLAFAAAVAWVAWGMVRVVLQSDRAVGGLEKLARGLGALVGLWLVYVALSWAFGAVRADLPYGVPQQFLTIPYWNNFFLMAVLIWIQTGFAMVILSAALRGVPEDTIEAAIIDGANPFQVFFKIKVPQIMGTIVVVWTTITITVLKVFDIVLAMTNGQFQTQVLANYMYDKLFRAGDWGVGSASAMVIMLLVMPILVWNVYNARKEMR
ncbi:MAG: sugar ABC transporter permease [Tabrizicola sp.]|uniref:carbohydrate ABC transporter permease n=1 Tax=Tabrizicola sp. TaxID=2005166 RepID=UPI0027365D53|nr:sugar ABC transporter permease [Tabrizicola sp.]MDP3263292.1 sugar ABC transporter permease [Tabrizicola sp.]MDP3646649.1 sugar ABC transporter permease [Paracoccaceae bacterium]MDZ4065777.1 sugar ABC transporter permease [Tabrizicola sp.]